MRRLRLLRGVLILKGSGLVMMAGSGEKGVLISRIGGVLASLMVPWASSSTESSPSDSARLLFLEPSLKDLTWLREKGGGEYSPS